jgi:hypothetical protein
VRSCGRLCGRECKASVCVDHLASTAASVFRLRPAGMQLEPSLTEDGTLSGLVSKPFYTFSEEEEEEEDV